MRILFLLFFWLFPVSIYGQVSHLTTVEEVTACDVARLSLQTTAKPGVRRFVTAKIAGMRCVEMGGRAEASRWLLSESVKVTIIRRAGTQWLVKLNLIKFDFAETDRLTVKDDWAEHLIKRGLAYSLPLKLAQAQSLDNETWLRYQAAQDEAKTNKAGIWHYDTDVTPFALSSFYRSMNENSPSLLRHPARPQKAITGHFRAKKNP